MLALNIFTKLGKALQSDKDSVKSYRSAYEKGGLQLIKEIED